MFIPISFPILNSLMESIPFNLHGFVSLFQFYTYIDINVTCEVNGHGKLDTKVRYTEGVWYIGLRELHVTTFLKIGFNPK